MKYIYLTVIFTVILAACNPVATTTQRTASTVSTETPSASPIMVTATPTVSPTSTQELYPPLLPSAPTSTALPTLRPGRSLILASIHMIDEQNGWGIDTGEHIVHTTDGGNSWKDVTPRNGAYQDRGFFALDANTAWATPYQQACYVENCPPNLTDASVWHTTDGGNTWQEQHVCLQNQDCHFDFDAFPEYYYPVAIHFADMQSGWLLVVVLHLMFQDRYRIYRTTDGGTHWSPIVDSMGGPWTMSVTGLAFQDKQTGWFSTSQIDGATDPIADWSVYQSTDAGLTWSEFPLPAPEPLPKTFANNAAWCGATGVTALSPSVLGVTIHCRVYTNPLSEYDFYFHSVDSGKHWISWRKTGDVDFINPDTGWQLTLDNGAYDIGQTLDGGQTWKKVKAVKWKGDLDFVSEQIGWAIATFDDIVTLVHTIDGGKTWQEIKPVVTTP